jgi:hypothetical protein
MQALGIIYGFIILYSELKNKFGENLIRALVNSILSKMKRISDFLIPEGFCYQSKVFTISPAI